MRFVACALVALLMTMSPVSAEDAKPKSDAVKAEKVSTKNPHMQKIEEKAAALAKTLSEEEAKRLGMVRENFGIIGSVEIARETVDKAVKLCAEKNEGLAADITARHKTWRSEIGAELDKQQKKLDSIVTKDHFSEPAKVQDYLDTIDDAAQHANTDVGKNIVTSEDACRNLMGSMDDTQKVITGLVKGLEWPADGKSEEKKQN